MPRHNRLNNLMDSTMHALPLRREVRAVLHFLNSHAESIRTGLDIGFTNAGVSRMLRLLGGYWMTVESSAQRRDLVATVLGGETVLTIGLNGELPFEDKQFDVVVLAHDSLSGGAKAGRAIKECHRVLRTGGLFLFTVEYRKRWTLRSVPDTGNRYTESEIFHLLKDGFDVLGFRFSCRFWVQLIRQRVAGRKESGARNANPVWLRALYGVAWLLDLPLFLTRGNQMTVCARRKGWRGEYARVLGSHTPVSNAIHIHAFHLR